MRGYDEWKLMTPEEDYGHKHIISGGLLCPFCGAYSPRQCELEEETGGDCPWEMSEPEPDPDYLLEMRRDDRDFA